MALCREISFIFISFILFREGDFVRQFTEKEIFHYKARVARMFEHAYNGYLKHAFPFDELRPLTCDGHDTWGSYSLTLIDALDTLVVMGNHSEFRRVVHLLEETLDFDRDINVSVFETNIRVVGGLLSAHLMSRRAGVVLEPGWPCTGPLLRLAEKVARKLLPAFNTPTGMPYGTVNLLYGVPKGETPITCTAGVGTFLIEFGALSQLTGAPVFLDTALRALYGLWSVKSSIGLVGNHIDVMTGKWTALDASIGAGIDSYFEYLVKGAILFQFPDLMNMFQEYKVSLTKYLKREDWYMWVHMEKGGVTNPLFQSLEAFWPGLLSLTGDIDGAMKTLHNYHQIWRQYGFTPEFYNIPKSDAHAGREGYPLRPEFIESTMYLYKATQDPFLLEVAVDVLESIEHSARTSCGYATVKNVKDHMLENRMESFFLAETTKYLYLMFDVDNFMHNTGDQGSVIMTPRGQCIIEAGGYVFNTEAHPVDAGALYCCSQDKQKHEEEIDKIFSHIDLLRLVGIDEDDDVDMSKKKEMVEEFEDEDESGEDLSVEQGESKVEDGSANNVVEGGVKTTELKSEEVGKEIHCSRVESLPGNVDSIECRTIEKPSVEDVVPRVEDVNPSVKDVVPRVEDVKPSVEDVPRVEDVKPGVEDVIPRVEELGKQVEGKDLKSEKGDSGLECCSSLKSTLESNEGDLGIQDVIKDGKSSKDEEGNPVGLQLEEPLVKETADMSEKSQQVMETVEVTPSKCVVCQNIISPSVSPDGISVMQDPPIQPLPPSVVTILPPSEHLQTDKCVEINSNRTQNWYETFRNSSSWKTVRENMYRLLTCPARPFHARLSLLGEMFIDE